MVYVKILFFFQVSYTVRGRGLVARFRCNNGYKLKGSPFAICLSGIWRHPVPNCHPEDGEFSFIFLLDEISPHRIDCDIFTNSITY